MKYFVQSKTTHKICIKKITLVNFDNQNEFVREFKQYRADSIIEWLTERKNGITNVFILTRARAKASKATTAARITNVYYDCLEQIFHFLELESLLNVTVTCKRRQIAAAAKFGDSFGKKLIGSYLSPHRQCGSSRLWFKIMFEIPFGAKTSYSMVFQDDAVSAPRTGCLDQYLAVWKHCADNLSRIFFCHKRSFSIHERELFKNTKSVNIFMCCDLKNYLPKFTNSFPSLRSFQLKVSTQLP